jgi:hypothetical protein
MSVSRIPRDEFRSRYKTIPYRLVNGLAGFSMEDIYYATSQAFSIWAAYTPVQFVRKTATSANDVHIEFTPQGEGGLLGNAIIAIDSDERFFIDKYRTPDDHGRYGPFDLVGAICHEIGHNVYGYLIHDPHEDNNISGSMMQGTQGENQVRRTLLPEDIVYAQKKFGKLPTPTLIPMDLATASQINYAPDVVFEPTPSGIFINGHPGTTSLFQLYSTKAKNKKVNVLNISLRTYSSYAIVNSVEIWDGIVLKEHHVLSLCSNQDTLKDYTLKIGLASKPVFKYGLLIRIELLFMQKLPDEGSPVAGRIRQVDITSIEIETIPKPIDSLFIQ